MTVSRPKPRYGYRPSLLLFAVGDRVIGLKEPHIAELGKAMEITKITIVRQHTSVWHLSVKWESGSETIFGAIDPQDFTNSLRKI
jgi:hypothetical protein